MTNHVERIKLQATVTAVIHLEGSLWVGRIEEIPAVRAQSRTSTGLLDYLEKALRGEPASTSDSWVPQPQTLEQTKQNSDTMTHQEPIEVPDELVHSWWPSDGYYERDGDLNDFADKVAQWAADRELDACCDWLRLQEDPQFRTEDGWVGPDQELREARRPKVPTLNDIALQFLGTIEKDGRYLPEITGTIRKALIEGGKSLQDNNG